MAGRFKEAWPLGSNPYELSALKEERMPKLAPNHTPAVGL